MKRIAGDRGKCWASRKTLALQCGFSVHRLDKSIKYLLDHEWIKRVGTRKIAATEGGMQTVYEYRIVDLWKKNIQYYEENKGSPPETLPYTKGSPRTDVKVVHGPIKGSPPEAYKEDIRTKEELKNKEEPIDHVASKDAPMIVDVIESFALVNSAYEKWFARPPQREAARRLIKCYGLEQLKKVIKLLPVSNTIPYFPTITTPIELEDKWAKLEAAWQRKKNENDTKKNKIAF